MALTDKLTDIADAIRSKTGKTGTMTLAEMPAEIAGITTETADLLLPADYPDYVRNEVLEIVNKVRGVRKSDSIVFVALSDSHYPGDQAVTYYGNETRASMLQANQAAKALAYMLDLDFVAHLGDVSWGGDDTTPAMLESQIEDFVAHFTEAGQSIPMFICIGNHDAGIYYHNAVADGSIHTMPGNYLYNNFTAHSASADTVFGGQAYGGYCYRDFADKKLRVIMLNTSEKLAAVQADLGTYGAQRVWLANALLNLNSKSDAADWGFVILCHYPADYGDNIILSNVLKAYVNGTSVTITDAAGGYYQGDGTNQTISFAGKNSAKFVAQFHGHIHNFKTDKLSVYENGSKVSYDGWRICVPNGQFNRENEYTTIGSYTEINFGEDESYPKTANSENGTSFVVNVINPSEEKIYSFAYGAGYDRIVGYGAIPRYTITNNLSEKAASSNSVTSIDEGQSYTATITTLSGYEIKDVTVTMGGADITSSVYSGGTITIPEVTGDIVITVTTSGYTNMIPLSTTAFRGTELFNPPKGYKTGTRLNSSGVEKASTYMCCTGFIPLSGTTGGDVIRIKNVTVAPASGYDTPYFFVLNENGTVCASTSTLDAGNYSDNKLTITKNGDVTTIVLNDRDVQYHAFRLSFGTIDETSIVTVNEEID